MTVLGAILAGGQSRRFGSDKAFADLNGKPMIVRVAEALSPFVDAIVVCGHAAPPQGMIAIDDRPHAGLGPLGGLAGALMRARALGHRAVVSVGCDTPILDAELIAQLCACEGDVFVRDLPIMGRWATDHADALLHHLAGDTTRSMRGWAAAIGALPIDAPRPIPNVNTRTDLADLQR